MPVTYTTKMTEARRQEIRQNSFERLRDAAANHVARINSDADWQCVCKECEKIREGVARTLSEMIAMLRLAPAVDTSAKHAHEGC